MTNSPPGLAFHIPSGSTVQSNNEGATSTGDFTASGHCCSPAGLSLRCKLRKARRKSIVRALLKHKRICLTSSMSGFCGRQYNTTLCRLLCQCPRCLAPVSSMLLQSHFLRTWLWRGLSTKVPCASPAVQPYRRPMPPLPGISISTSIW